MRNSGGFHLPPVIPATDTQLQRAVELLGSCTQRKRMRACTKAELQNLVGQLPTNRLIAQQWKVSLQRQMSVEKREARPQRQSDGVAFHHRDALARQLPLPHAQSDLSRVFILLEVVRKRYSTATPVSPRLASEIAHIVGSCPATALDARRYIRALACLQQQRRRTERRPPNMPLDDASALREATMLLGAYAMHGSVGAQTGRLVAIIGAAPRNKNVAASWKKVMAAAIRKKKRKDRVHLKRVVDDDKRLQRRLKRREQQGQDKSAVTGELMQDHVKVISSEYDVDCDDEVSDEPPVLLEEPLVTISTTGEMHDGSEGELETRYLSRLYTMLERFFTSR